MKREKAEKPNGMSYVIMRQAGNFFGDLLHCYENEQTRLEKSNDIAKDKLMWTNPKLCLFFAEPYAEYKIWIKAYTFKNEGKSSEPLIVRTDVRAPGPPIVVNLTCQNGHTLFLKWLRPTMYYRTVDVYNVHYRPEGNEDFENQVVETVNNTINHMVISISTELESKLPGKDHHRSY
jgi:hypothetical protein